MGSSLTEILHYNILTIGGYNINILQTLLIVPAFILDVFFVRLLTRIFRKRKLLEKPFPRTALRVLKGIIHFIVFIGIMRILGVELSNILDFIVAILNFKLFTIGGTQVSFITIIVMVIVVYASTKIASLTRKYFDTNIFPRFNIDEGVRFTLSKLIGYLIIAIGIIIALQGLGIKLTALTVLAGVLGVGIGFGMQSITANFVSGLAILFERPIKEGDMVRIGNHIGTVKKINLRASIIQTIFNEHLIVPNSQFINSIVENMSYGDLKIRIKVDVGVEYGSDPFYVREGLLEAVKKTDLILESPEPTILFREFGDSALNFQVLAWVKTPELRFRAESELHFAIVEEFNKRGITIPFPQRDVYIKQMPS